MKLQKHQKQNRRTIAVALTIAFVVSCLLVLAGSASADTMPTGTPTSQQVFIEPGVIGNDLLFQSATPINLQSIIDAELALYPSYISTSDEYQADFYANSTAFLFRVPMGTGVSTITEDPTAAPEPGAVVLLACGLFGLYWLGGLKAFKGRNAA